MTTENKPTQKQDELFLLSIRNFVADSDKHPALLFDSYLHINASEFNDWLDGKNLPETGIRVRVMDFIWTHHSYCSRICTR